MSRADPNASPSLAATAQDRRDTAGAVHDLAGGQAAYAAHAHSSVFGRAASHGQYTDPVHADSPTSDIFSSESGPAEQRAPLPARTESPAGSRRHRRRSSSHKHHHHHSRRSRSRDPHGVQQQQQQQQPRVLEREPVSAATEGTDPPTRVRPPPLPPVRPGSLNRTVYHNASGVQSGKEEVAAAGVVSPTTAVSFSEAGAPPNTSAKGSWQQTEAGGSAVAPPAQVVGEGESRFTPSYTTKNALGTFKHVLCFTVSQQWWHALLIAVPVVLFSVLFLVFVPPSGEVYSRVIVAVLMVLSVGCLLACVLVDPGIVPPAPFEDMPQAVEYVTVRGVRIECRPCRTCHVIRPPRSTHCQFCNVCVEEFDHHCGVVGSCVGKRTFRFFGGFFVVTTVLVIYMFVRSIISAVHVGRDLGESSANRSTLAVSIVCTIAAFMGGCIVVPFAYMYIYLGCTNLTQKEMLRNESTGLCPQNYPYAGNHCWDLVLRYCRPLGSSRVTKDYII